MSKIASAPSSAAIFTSTVDSHKDFPGADHYDGEQLPGDRAGNAAVTFVKAPAFSVADYYDRSRLRTCAFCAALEDTGHVWTCGSRSPKGNVGLVFDFHRLRAALNRMLQSGGAGLELNGIRCRKIFDLNYGMVDYVDWATHRANEARLPNPITYAYLKDTVRFAEERELRISLSALGIGKFVLDDPGSRLRSSLRYRLLVLGADSARRHDRDRDALDRTTRGADQASVCK